VRHISLTRPISGPNIPTLWSVSRSLAANLGIAITEDDEMRGVVKPWQTTGQKNVHLSCVKV
jgi:hypothetical protein